MFTGFFYLLRAHGFRVSLNEWMTLIEGLMLDLQHDSLTGFYELCRAVLVKSEADYDKFDQIFLEYFDGVPYQDELPKELMDWLNNPAAAMEEFRKFLRTQGYEEKSIEEILKMFEERLKEQTEDAVAARGSWLCDVACHMEFFPRAVHGQHILRQFPAEHRIDRVLA